MRRTSVDHSIATDAKSRVSSKRSALAVVQWCFFHFQHVLCSIVVPRMFSTASFTLADAYHDDSYENQSNTQPCESISSSRPYASINNSRGRSYEHSRLSVSSRKLRGQSQKAGERRGKHILKYETGLCRPALKMLPTRHHMQYV
jgi:hypothetical protein